MTDPEGRPLGNRALRPQDLYQKVNGIAPGYFNTAMTRTLVEDKAFTDWLCKRTPAARWGDPQELVGAAVFLSSNASNFVNGHLLFVDGGMLVAV